MYNKKPPFEITTSILDKIAEIAELVGQVNAVAGLTTNPMLRRTDRIRTIYSSLAIEQNTLSLEQVTAVLHGKRVIAPPKDIAEVKARSLQLSTEQHTPGCKIHHLPWFRRRHIPGGSIHMHDR